MELALYTRNESGQITYHGEEEWPSVEDCLAAYYRDGYPTERTELIGWPDAAVSWHGNTGIAIRSYYGQQ